MNEAKIGDGKNNNFKSWSFRLLIYLLIINIVVFYMVVNFDDGFDNSEKFNQNLYILSMIGNLILLIGVVLTIFSVVKREEKNYQYYTSVIGYPIIMIISFLMSSL